MRAQGEETLRRRGEPGLCQTVGFQRRCGDALKMVPSFSQQIFIEQLICVRHCSKHQKSSREYNRQKTAALVEPCLSTHVKTHWRYNLFVRSYKSSLFSFHLLSANYISVSKQKLIYY